MKTLLAIVAVAAFAATAGAQQTTASGAANAMGSAHSSVSHASSSAASTAEASTADSAAAQAGRASASAAQATQVSARLTRELDSRHARVGEQVLAKTTSAARLSDGTKLPRGTRLLGHVTQVQAKSRAHHDAQLAFAFDRAILRNGHEIPIHAFMRSISAPAPLDASGSGDMMGAGAISGPAPVAGGGMMSGGGGLGGGLVGGAAGAAGAGLGAAGGMAGRGASSLGGTASGMAGSAAGMDRGAMNLSEATQGSSAFSGARFPVGNLSGVTFSNIAASGTAGRNGVSGSAASSGATMLSAQNRNVELESGSQMAMSVSPR